MKEIGAPETHSSDLTDKEIERITDGACTMSQIDDSNIVDVIIKLSKFREYIYQHHPEAAADAEAFMHDQKRKKIYMAMPPKGVR